MTNEQKDNMRKWIAALRSGEYAQTKGVLKDDKGFCCLGVACEIGLLEKDTKRLSRENKETMPTRESVMEAFGFDNNTVVLWGHDVTYFNDAACWSFDRIADGLAERYLNE